MISLRKIIKKEWFWLGIVILTAGFLYFYKLGQWQYLNYDQARDYLIIKRLIINHKLTLIGPSLGILDGGYQPPLYYYLLAPSFLISGFHIWGPDALTAIISLTSLVVFYFVARDFFGKIPALAGSLIYALNPYMIQAARHARNPHWLPIFVLLFLFSFKKYLLDKKRKFLLIASLSLAAAISLHVTAIVFLPFWIYLIYRDWRQFKISRRLIVSLACFSIFFAPLILFVFRHDFLMAKAVLNFFTPKDNSSIWQIFLRIGRLAIFFFKIPLIFFAGLYQKELLSLRSLPLASLDKVNFFGLKNFEFIKLILSAGLSGLLMVALLDNLRKRNNLYCLLGAFIFAGFAVSLMCPPDGSFLYYFYNLFPFLLLLFSGAIAWWLKKSQKLPLLLYLSIFWAIMPLFPNGLKTEIRPESYFAPVSELIAKDAGQNEKIAVAANVKESARWEKNALEYRYFLEAIYRMPPTAWDAAGYQQANVLYLIDEKGETEPLKIGGMEMEAFEPKKIVKVWEAKTGQKIYKLLKN